MGKSLLKEAHATLEKIAEKEMSNNPLEFFKNETLAGLGQPKQRPQTTINPHTEFGDNPKDAHLVEDMEFIDELETIYMDANEEIKKSILLLNGD